MTGPEFVGELVGSVKPYRQVDAPQHRFAIQLPNQMAASSGTVTAIYNTASIVTGRGFNRVSTFQGYIEFELGSLEVGTWYVTVWTIKGPDRGILQVTTPDGVTQASFDAYTAAAAAAQQLTYSVNIADLTSSRRLRITNLGKNAASTQPWVDTCLILGRRYGP